MTLRAILRQLTAVHMIMLTVIVVSLPALVSMRVKQALILEPKRVWRRRELYRLLTAGWIHGDLGHLATNMFVFYLFADPVLRHFGKLPFVLFYVSAVVIAYVPTTIRFRDHPRYRSLGASGGVAAIMFAAILLVPSLRLYGGLPGIVYAVLYMLYSIWHSAGSDDNVNHDAHFSGAAYGAAVTFLVAPTRAKQTVRVLLDFFGL